MLALHLLPILFLTIFPSHALSTPPRPPLHCFVAEGSVLKLITERKNWDDARNHCRATKVLGATGDLVVAKTKTTNTALVLIQHSQKSKKGLWMGGRYRKEKWFWVDDTAMDLNDWNWEWDGPVYEDYDYYENKECVMIGETGPRYLSWKKRECRLRRHFVCQYFPTEYKAVSGQNGTRFIKFYDEPMVYLEAEKACQKVHGELVVADTDEIHAWLGDKAGKSWVGATDLKEEGSWIWSNGQKLSTKSKFWVKGGPDNQVRAEHCALYTNDGLDDRYCREKHPYVCEFSPCSSKDC